MCIYGAAVPALRPVLLGLSLALSGCTVAEIDRILAERGVTECSTDSSAAETAAVETGDGSTSTGAAEAGSTAAGTGAGTSEGAEASGADTTTAAEETTAAGSSSGGPTPFCGDGVVNQTFEECDDGNFDEADRCAITCQRMRLVFVSSVVLQGKMNGLQGADAYCRSLALAAMKADPGSPIADPANFKALLTTSTQTVWDRHFNGKGPYVLVTGARVSDSFAALFSAPLQHAINVDERGETKIAAVYTGTDVDGSPFPGIDFCADWTSNWGSNNYGSSDATNSDWIYNAGPYNPEDHCTSERSIYCIEQE